MSLVSEKRQDRTGSEWQSLISALKPQVFVSVVNGKVTLRGTVRTFAEKRALEQTVSGVPGIRALTNEITVSASSGPEHDAYLAREISQLLHHQNYSMNDKSEEPYWRFFEV
jgi:hypothetical protein